MCVSKANRPLQIYLDSHDTRRRVALVMLLCSRAAKLAILFGRTPKEHQTKPIAVVSLIGLVIINLHGPCVYWTSFYKAIKCQRSL